MVGFGVDAKAKEQLQCLADAGGGKYFGAGDKDELLTALQSVQEEVTVKVEKAKSEPAKAKTGLPMVIVKYPNVVTRARPAGYR